MNTYDTWQEFIKAIVNRASQGYTLFYSVELPERKKDSWSELKSKIDNFYKSNLSKKQRQTQRQKNHKTFLTACFEDKVVIQATEKGSFPKNIKESVQKMFKNSYKLKTGEIIEVEIKKVFYNKKHYISVFLTKQSTDILKKQLNEILALKDDKIKQQKLRVFFSKLYHLPKYIGIFAQIEELRKYAKNKQHSVLTKITVKKSRRRKAK